MTDFGKKSKFGLRPCKYGFTPNLNSSWKTFNEECLRESQETTLKIESPVKSVVFVHEENKVA